MASYKKYSKQDQKTLAACAAQWAERVLPYFEESFPDDKRPRRAIEACRKWVRNGVFKMTEIRGSSLSSHAAARDANEVPVACFAARSAGHAVATAHVTQHAYGAAYYALKAAAAHDFSKAEVNTAREREWQSRRLPTNLRKEFLKRVIIQKDDRGISIKIGKGKGF